MDAFVEFSVVIVIAAVLSLLVRILKQPPLVGYILTGLLVGPYAFNTLHAPELLNTFSEFGIALLLFIVGLHLSPKVIKEVGKASLVIALIQITFNIILGFLMSKAFHYSNIEAAFIGVALSFSSTIIVLKMLYDHEALDKLHGKLAIGLLLVQDIVAMVILVVVSALSAGGTPQEIVFPLVLKGSFLAVVLYVSYKLLLPRIMSYFAKSQELMFLFTLAWGMGMASLFEQMGFSVEIGALTAGVVLSLSPYSYEMSSKMRPLRDFFLVVFFIALGYQIVIEDVVSLIPQAVVFSAFILIVNPLLVMTAVSLLGYSRKSGFLAGIAVAQISEFSLIILRIGYEEGHIGTDILTLMTIVGITTITLSTYMILYADVLYIKLAPVLSIFETRHPKDHPEREMHYDIMLFGSNRIGYDFVEIFLKSHAHFLVVDFNPQTVKDFQERGVPSLYGDASDAEFLDDLNIEACRMIISTIPDFETNAFLLEKAKSRKKHIVILVVAHQIHDAFELYKLGADYVIMPHFLGGKYASSLVHRYGFHREKYDEEREHQLKSLTERLEMGHEHPETTRG